ncbi:hypothetical protein AGMMS4952_17950 [Spirochaetia bacterium]|nr:hypothetical protein AGMMS4952_17950 [Spirochaetia bacterium]
MQRTQRDKKAGIQKRMIPLSLPFSSLFFTISVFILHYQNCSAKKKIGGMYEKDYFRNGDGGASIAGLSHGNGG